VELYGVASAKAYAQAFPEKPQPTRFIEDARSVVVIGLSFEPGTVSTVLNPELAGLRGKAADQVGASGTQPVGAERFFLGEENGIISREISLMAYKMAKHLRQQGWKSFYLPTAKQNARFRTAPFYHMPAMYLAGMGTLGYNASILTPQFGPRVFVTSIITNCPLPAGKPMEKEMCTHCKLCVENCPIGALDGKGWKNPFACASYGCCGTCIAICPVGEV
jgi:epoxyqueuosine reductase QueG